MCKQLTGSLAQNHCIQKYPSNEKSVNIANNSLIKSTLQFIFSAHLTCILWWLVTSLMKISSVGGKVFEPNNLRVQEELDLQHFQRVLRGMSNDASYCLLIFGCQSGFCHFPVDFCAHCRACWCTNICGGMTKAARATTDAYARLLLAFVATGKACQAQWGHPPDQSLAFRWG